MSPEETLIEADREQEEAAHEMLFSLTRLKAHANKNHDAELLLELSTFSTLTAKFLMAAGDFSMAAAQVMDSKERFGNFSS
jgi:hypothetical protein